VGSRSRVDLIQAWLRYNANEYEHTHPDENDPDWWAVMELKLREPDEAWNLMADIARMAYTDWQLTMVGCGPLEDFLMLDPDRYITDLEETARTNRNLVTAAACIWLDSDPIRPRIDALLSRYGQHRL
jgi:hypothetical protein